MRERGRVKRDVITQIDILPLVEISICIKTSHFT